jgi:hypothetical protein
VDRHYESAYERLGDTEFRFRKLRSVCVPVFLRFGGLYLKNDSDDGWLGPLTPGVAGTLSNSRCTLCGHKGHLPVRIDTAGLTATPTREQRGTWTLTTAP